MLNEISSILWSPCLSVMCALCLDWITWIGYVKIVAIALANAPTIKNSKAPHRLSTKQCHSFNLLGSLPGLILPNVFLTLQTQFSIWTKDTSHKLQIEWLDYTPKQVMVSLQTKILWVLLLSKVQQVHEKFLFLKTMNDDQIKNNSKNLYNGLSSTLWSLILVLITQTGLVIILFRFSWSICWFQKLTHWWHQQ